MAEYNIKLIEYPDFFNEYEVGIDFVNFNDDFWKQLFISKTFLGYIDFGSLSKNDKNDLKYVLANLGNSYKIFKLYKSKYIGIENLVFAFNIIFKYIEILNIYLNNVNLNFYREFVFKGESKLDLKATIFYDFYSKYIEYFKEYKDGDVLNIDILFPHQLVQISIIELIFKELGINVFFNFNLGWLYEFENKIIFKKKLEKKYSNISKINLKEIKIRSTRKILGSEYCSRSFLGPGCSWRKCSFCNIGRFENAIEYENVEQRIKTFVNHIKDNNIKYLNLSDSSIEFESLLDLCKALIKENRKVYMHIRMRFSDKFTDDNCKILSKAGVKYVGLGLESASNRINKLMKKYDFDHTESYFQEIIDNCIKNKINVHVYTIFGFPTETKREAMQTYKFLERNILQNGFFSFTAGRFCLNRGTDIFNNPSKYGIVIFNNEQITKTHLENYRELEEQNFSNEEMKKLLELLYNKLFFGSIKNNLKIKDFWFFIEESKLFHMFKLQMSENPFLNKFRIIDKSEKNIKKLAFLQFFKDTYIIKNWITMKEIILDREDFNFIYNYNNSLSLDENIEKNNYKKDSLELFFNNYILVPV